MWAEFDPGQYLTAADLEAIGEFTAFTPTVTGVTVGNGTSSGKWCRFGRLVVVQMEFVLGSTSAVTGSVNFALPVTNSQLAISGEFDARLVDISALQTRVGAGQLVAGDQVTVSSIGASQQLTALAAGSPFAWATGDAIRTAGWYVVNP